MLSSEKKRLSKMLVHERKLGRDGITVIAGVDEVGAGCLAGPVLAAAVILPKNWRAAGINDSKKVTAKKRTLLAQIIREAAVAYAFGLCSPAEIDEMNILQASLEAMRRAVVGLATQPHHLLVDARHVPMLEVPQTALIKGDNLSLSIAAASILAKVERDLMMERLALEYPGYGLEQHRGYGTQMHLEALARLGATPIHRYSFAPVAANCRSSEMTG